MIYFKSLVILTSILLGALFFCPHYLSAQDEAVNIDSTSMQDTTSFVKSLIRQKKALPADSSLKSKDERVVLLNDSIQLEKDSVLTRNDTILLMNDSITVLNENTLSNNKYRDHSPPRATILSAVVPGLGQAYNRKYWKIPIIYAAGGGLYWYFDYANERFNYWKGIYETEFAKGSEGDKAIMDNAVLNRDVWSKRRGYSVIFIGILYVANVVDAMVDAHFLRFNVSDDLSMKIEPNLYQIPAQYAFDSFSYGVTLSLNF